MESAVKNQGRAVYFQGLIADPVWRLSEDPARQGNPATDADQAYHQLRERILRLKLQPGTPIRDTAIMKELELGRTPIREALKRLEVELLVESHHRRGTFVRPIRLPEIKQQYQIRRQLICLGVGLAAAFLAGQGASRNNTSAFLEFLQSQDDLTAVIQGVAHLDMQIAQAASSRYLWATLDQYYGYARRSWMFVKERLTPADFFLEDYQEILALIHQGMGEEASLKMASHVDRVHLAVVDSYLKKMI